MSLADELVVACHVASFAFSGKVESEGRKISVKTGDRGWCDLSRRSERRLSPEKCGELSRKGDLIFLTERDETGFELNGKTAKGSKRMRFNKKDSSFVRCVHASKLQHLSAISVLFFALKGSAVFHHI